MPKILSQLAEVANTLRFTNLGSLPVSPSDGDIVYYASNGFRFRQGGSWVSLGGGTDFADNVFRISDDGDSTKKIAFQASGITTATVRTITMPDRNVTLDTLVDSTTSITGSVSSGSNNGILYSDAATGKLKTSSNILYYSFGSQEGLYVSGGGGAGVGNFTSTGNGAAILWVNSRDASPSGLKYGLFLNLNPSSGTPTNGYGMSLGWFGKTNGGSERDLVYLDGFWSDVTDATRTGALAFRIANNAVFAEKFRMTGQGVLQIGSNTSYVGLTVSSPTSYTITLPSAAPGTNTYLKYDGANYTWATGTVTSVNEYADNVFRVVDNADATKKFAFEVSAITTATTRTATVPNRDFSLDQITSGTTDWSGGASTGVLFADGSSKVANSSKLTWDNSGFVFAVDSTIRIGTSGNYVGLTVSAPTSYTITLPGSAPASDTYLKYNGSSYVWATVSLTPDFADNVFRISDNTDATKKIAFEASGITTATVRTVTMPNRNITLDALTSGTTDWSGGGARGILFDNGSGKIVNDSQFRLATIATGAAYSYMSIQNCLSIFQSNQSGYDVLQVNHISGDASTYALKVSKTLSFNNSSQKIVNFVANCASGTASGFGGHFLFSSTNSSGGLIDSHRLGWLMITTTSGSEVSAFTLELNNSSSSSTEQHRFLPKEHRIGNTGSYIGLAVNAPTSYTITLPDSAPGSNTYLKYNGSSYVWASVSVSPAGSNTEIQFNNSGAFGSSAQFFWDDTTKKLTVAKSTANTSSLQALRHYTSVTNSVQEALSIEMNNSGTSANGFGGSIVFRLATTTTSDIFASSIAGLWANATHGSRIGAMAIALSNVGTDVEYFRFLPNEFRIGTTSNYIGLGVSSPTSYTITLPASAPASNTALMFNGSSYIWGSTSNSFTATIDFGTNDDTDTTVVVTGLTWITTSMKIVCTVQGEDALIQCIQAAAESIVNGTGCTIRAHAPLGANGTFTVNCIAV